MKNSNLIILTLALCMSGTAQDYSNKKITKNKMTVSWHFENDRIFFEMCAPTYGWVAIGFNTVIGTKEAYLIMGNILKGKPNVVEYFTINPGNYKPISSLGEISQVEDVTGNEKSANTTLLFSLPIKAVSKFQKDLSEGMEYTMIIAFSQEDDFQHHSIMRTSVEIKL